MGQGTVRALSVVMLALPLGACSSFLGIKFAHSAPKVRPVEAVAVVNPASTETGRKLLAEGRTGLAIEAFQRALTDGEPIAPAVNGLGVAYAQLGRDDLAERFFREAMAADPQNARYSDNLTRLMRSPSFASRSAAVIIAQANKDAAAIASEAKRETQAAEVKRPVTGQLQRISRAEVRINTAPSQAAPLRTASVKVDSRFKPLVRVVLAPTEPEGFKPVTRLEMPVAKPAEAKASSAR